MKRPHIIILYAPNPSRLPHLRKLWSLRDRYDFTMILRKADDHGWQGNFVERLIYFESVELNDRFAELLKEIEAVGKPDGIVNLSEFCVPLHARLCEHFNLPGPDSRIAEIGRNKSVMRKFAASLGIPVPKAIAATGSNLDECRDLAYPVIVKPIIGGGSTLVKRIESFEELKSVFHDLQELSKNVYRKDSLFGELLRQYGDFPLVVEEIIGGEVLFPTRFPYHVGEISVESVFYNGQTHVLGIHDKPLPSNGPHFEEFIWSTPTRIPASHILQAKSLVAKIHEGLGRGAYVLHTEFRTLPDTLVLLEFGVRMGGATIYSSLLHSTGNDFIEILLELAQGHEPTLSLGLSCPTISHSLWAPDTGRITALKGETALIESPYYVEHQVYDDVGQTAKRAPLSSRANGHVIYQSWKALNRWRTR